MGKSIRSKDDQEQQTLQNITITHQDGSNLSNFMKIIRQKFKKLEAKIALPKIHKIIKQNKKKINFNCQQIKESLRICKLCDKWNHINSIIQCSICQDHFHKDCLKGDWHQNFRCRNCSKIEYIRPEVCRICKKNIKNKQKIQVCTVQNGFCHQYCCKHKKCTRLQKQISKAKNFQQIILKSIDNEDTNTESSSFLFKFKKLVKNQQVRIYLKYLKRAIEDKGMIYTQQLVGFNKFSDLVQENLDFGLRCMNKQEQKVFEQYKKYPIGPYKLKKVQGKGYDVVADKDIEAKSIICEYVGEVLTHRQCIIRQNLCNKNDSMMELQAGKNAGRTLIIRPQKFTNIARFINGVKKGESHKANVSSMRFIYKQRPLVLLIAKQNIKKNESLCYDYNAGGIAAEYDTSYFT